MSSNLESVSESKLVDAGLEIDEAKAIHAAFTGIVKNLSADTYAEVWMRITWEILRPSTPFSVHSLFKDIVFGNHYDHMPPLWYPNKETIADTNLFKFMQSLVEDGTWQEHAIDDVEKAFECLFDLAFNEPEVYWRRLLKFMSICFATEAKEILSYGTQEDDIVWFHGCQLNIADLALRKIASSDRAIIWKDENDQSDCLMFMSGHELRELSFHVAAAIASTCETGTYIAVYLPMTTTVVAIYLGIILAGCIVVSIADSFSAPEVQTRLQITNTTVVFTQDVILRGEKTHTLYEKIVNIDNIQCIVVSATPPNLKVQLKQGDLSFEQFLEGVDGKSFSPVVCSGYTQSNILFSSGTTGAPKAIPWTHLTPLKSGIDGMFYQDIKETSVVCWPTSLGWMMGPWLLFASFLNGAAMALYQGSPLSPSFCKFVEIAQVTVLGVIPSIVRQWKNKRMTAGCDWSKVRCFSSTGESSSYDEYHWLMAQAGYKPVIEYCGGTEIGGAYITGCLLHPQTPSGFTTPCLGCSLVVLQDSSISQVHITNTFVGELAIEPPFFGLSQSLLNKNHVQEYYEGMPQYGNRHYHLRRHGDVFTKTSHGFYFSRGRADDTMNLGGIKVSCIELEYAVMKRVSLIKEAAAVSYTYGTGGPEELALFLVLHSKKDVDLDSLTDACQQAIKKDLNPLFKVSQVLLRDELPRTSSNKIVRKILREELRQSRL